MSKELKFGLKTITMAITIISCIIGSLWGVAEFSYKAGSQSDLVKREVSRVETKVDTNHLQIKEQKKQYEKHCEIEAVKFEKIGETMADNTIQLRVQSEILTRIERKLDN